MQVLQQAFLWSFSCNMQPVQGAAELGAGQLDVALLRGRCDASLSAGLCGLGTGDVDLIGIFERGGDETYLALLHAEKAAAAGCMPRLAVFVTTTRPMSSAAI